MSVVMLEEAHGLLGDLVEQVIFLGGAAIALWVTDPAAPSPRPTLDVDVVVEVATRGEFHEFEERLRAAGFQEDSTSGVICRWRHRSAGLVLDAIPGQPHLMGFSNGWVEAAIPHSIRCRLPNGATIRALSPPYLVATKLDAFASRGEGDYVRSRDFADVIAIVDGREEFIADVQGAVEDVRRYIAMTLGDMMRDPKFLDGVVTSLRPDAASQARADTVVLPRLRALALTG